MRFHCLELFPPILVFLRVFLGDPEARLIDALGKNNN